VGFLNSAIQFARAATSIGVRYLEVGAPPAISLARKSLSLPKCLLDAKAV
jgi:hypothetical protein